MVIWKVELKVEEEQYIGFPKGADILCVQMQHGKPCIWALCNEKNKIELIKIIIKGTGHRFDNAENLLYIGTFQMAGGDLVFHTFIERERV